MAFTIPTQAAAHHVHMSEWDRGDLEYLKEAALGNGVMTGCAVTPQGTPDMTVQVAAGSVRTRNLTTYEVTAGNATITTADGTYPRIDIVVATITGTKAVRAGTPDPNPIHPTLTVGDVALALVYIEASEGAIEANMIADKRLFPRGHVYVRKTANETVTSSTTLQDDDHLFFYCGADEVWWIQGDLFFTASDTTPGHRVGITGPTGSDIDHGQMSGDGFGGLGENIFYTADISGAAATVIANGRAATSNIKGCNLQVVLENGSTAGMVRVQWAQGISSGTTLNSLEDGWIEARKLKG